ncbi:hypothetical protein Ga0609869_001725 [Rhodovulum iodosum]|uniref:H-type lectin domain-containing protein n=1 Tax=Rhodovulum iodosum TaxID=68291 RepID=A0ABV3XSS6_9RHOB|nr:H-type lectin domain-containing protein [Rhodovulum robiginosum]RSK30687.1 hypothetical protein EJA01_18165 [Rhodovulum robiginosum]
MQTFDGRMIGVDRGSVVLFSDFEHDGVMWTGTGPRASRTPVRFSQSFRAPPVVYVGISMWDLDQKTNQRADISAENVTEDGFDVVFKTWADTRVARIRADWMAIGAARHEDDWDVT